MEEGACNHWAGKWHEGEKRSRDSDQKERTNHVKDKVFDLAEEWKEGGERDREDDFDLKVKIKHG